MSSVQFPNKTLSSETYRGFIVAKAALKKSPLGPELVELINLRVSQINGCNHGLDLQNASILETIIPGTKIDSLAGWRVSSKFNNRERAALAWAESLVDPAYIHAPSTTFFPLKDHFSEVEISDLYFTVVLVSAFNRIVIGFYQ